MPTDGKLHNCNTLKFALLKIELKWFICEFLCTWNIGKRIFFIILKFIIRSSNLDVHTCRCIWFIAMSGWIQNSKWIQNAFENEFESGFEIKELKRKENWKIKEFSKVCKSSVLETTQKFSSWKVYLKLYLNLIWIWIEKGKWENFEKRKNSFPSLLAQPA